MHSYGSLNHPPVHPSSTQERNKEYLIKQDIDFQVNLQTSDISEEDKSFFDEKKKRDIYKDKILLDAFQMVRKYDFLPRAVVNDCFKQVINYVYQCNYKVKEQREKLANMECDLAANVRLNEETND